jgi:hypothetical protein
MAVVRDQMAAILVRLLAVIRTMPVAVHIHVVNDSD